MHRDTGHVILRLPSAVAARPANQITSRYVIRAESFFVKDSFPGDAKGGKSATRRQLCRVVGSVTVVVAVVAVVAVVDDAFNSAAAAQFYEGAR